VDNEYGKVFIISPKFDRNGMLRISKDCAAFFIGKTIIQGRATVPSGQEFPIILNVPNRTLIGLETWLRSLSDDQDYTSFQICVTTENPLKLRISPSNEPLLSVENDRVNALSRPNEGLYLGRKLDDHFNELVPTNEPFIIEKSDLLTHAFICGVAGAGKTVICKALLEEAALERIPVIAIDLKGDISSMALMMSGDDPEEFLQWIEPGHNQTREELAVKRAREHRHNLNQYGVSPAFIEDAKKRIGVSIFTPRSNDGFRLSLSAFPEPPENLFETKESDPDEYDSLIDFLAEQFVSRLSVNKTQSAKAKGYVFEIIKVCFSRNISMNGYDGVKKVLGEFRSPELGIDQIGDLATGDYITAKDREALANATNALLTGTGRRMYEGWPVSIDTLVNPKFAGDRTPVSIINVAHLDFKDQAYVVGYIAYLIWFWMRRLPGTYDPRLIFYIDEIGGGVARLLFSPVSQAPHASQHLTLFYGRGVLLGYAVFLQRRIPATLTTRD
jgi:hypothetical protein